MALTPYDSTSLLEAMSAMTVWDIVNFKIQFNFLVGITGFWTSPIVRYSKKLESAKFRKLVLFPSSGEGETPTLLGPLERANLNHWTILVRFITAI
jgi:hypothetical protein